MINAKYCGLAGLGFFCALSFLCTHVWAQSPFASGVVGVTNSSISGFIGGLDSNSSDGSAMSASASQSFTGQDGNDATQTMNFSGQVQASAEFGVMHISSSGTVTNTYFNVNNPVYYNSDTNTFDPAGSPDGLVSLGFAGFDDTLQYGGELQAGYKARYIFHVSGTNSGVGGAADLSVKIAGDADETFFDFDPGPFAANWATIDHNINGIDPQTIHVQFSDQFVANTQDFTDGSNVSGAANFADTLTLVQIIIVDANGNPVSGVTVSSASGTQYPVPEPTTVAIALPAILCLIRRQRKN